jgi:hypothetical protein
MPFDETPSAWTYPVLLQAGGAIVRSLASRSRGEACTTPLTIGSGTGVCARSARGCSSVRTATAHYGHFQNDFAARLN